MMMENLVETSVLGYKQVNFLGAVPQNFQTLTKTVIDVILNTVHVVA
jgi:hypothetical protein